MMNNKNYTASFLVDQTADEVFNAINNVYGWWSEDFKGSSDQLHDEFEVRFGDVHYSRHKITESVPGKKIAWLVTDSQLNFLSNKTEWNNTTIIFDIASKGDQTELNFTHVGLVPGIECYNNCSNGWRHYLNNSLIPMITTGKANPNQKRS